MGAEAFVRTSEGMRARASGVYAAVGVACEDVVGDVPKYSSKESCDRVNNRLEK